MTESTDSNHDSNAKEGPPSPGRQSPLTWCLLLLATGLGLGRIPVAPGTFGSFWGVLIVLGLTAVQDHPAFRFACGVVLFLVGIPICAAGIRHYQTQDPKSVVFDEIAAFPFVFLLVPVTWGTAVAGFVLFRTFDIIKPWPVKWFEKFPGAWGVMSDDLVAGVMAGAVLTVSWWAIGPF